MKANINLFVLLSIGIINIYPPYDVLACLYLVYFSIVCISVSCVLFSQNVKCKKNYEFYS